MHKCLFIALLFSWPVALQAAIDEPEYLARRIQAHLIIRDYPSAIEEARHSLLIYPQSAALHEGYIRALAKSGEEKIILRAWKAYVEQFPDKAMNRELVEDIAWGVIQKASRSSSLIMREMALLAAFFSQDAKGVAILSCGMRDSNYAVRSLAVKLSSHFRDQVLAAEIQRLFKEETVWAVRQQVIEAVGKMKMMGFKSTLEALIASDEGIESEKALAIAALLELLETINRAEVERLAASSRAGLRQLACRAIGHFQSLRDLDQLLLLAEDSHQDVRLAAFQAIGQLRSSERVEEIVAAARKGIGERAYRVAISAAWLLTLYAPEEGQRVFDLFFKDGRGEVRVFAAAALASTGRYGTALAIRQYRVHADPYVRLNLALGLIGQRLFVQECSVYIKRMMVDNREKWSIEEVGIFHPISNKYLRKIDDTLSSPEDNDQLLRLELLNLLAILNTPGTEETIRKYLLERSWTISATAATLLLKEGDDSAIELVQQLLRDNPQRVRLQAALILSLWSREESAIETLEEGYWSSHWELKSKILEGLGRIGSIRSIPFLINVLQEPSQTLRLIAAIAMIQCLNH